MKEQLLKEFEQKYGKEFMIKSEPYDYIHKGVDPSFSINYIKQFLSQAIEQTKKETREETIKDIEESLPEETFDNTYNYALKEVRDILNKLKN